MAVTGPTWTILVPTLGQRGEYLCQMLDGLLPQVDTQAGQVKVLAYWDNGEVDIATKKQALLDTAQGDYISYIDDDDTVSEDYVIRIVEALQSRPDYVGLKLQVYADGRPFALSHHSLRHGGWLNAGAPYLRRDITCANPMRTDIARTAKFTGAPAGTAEDVHWVGQLRGRLVTEVFVDRVLYHYWWMPSQSTWTTNYRLIRTVDTAGLPWRPIGVSSPYFSWHPDSPLPEGGADGGPADHCAGTHSDLEHRAPADRVVGHRRVRRC